MIEKKHTKELITPEEIVSITGRAGTIDSVDRARDIEQAFFELNKGKACNDSKWAYYCLLSAIYDGGRIQGIREERARQREKAKSIKEEQEAEQA